jgi:ABC-type bacteriocin/lantibiotic exporter with double-glycine peptidase domain
VAKELTQAIIKERGLDKPFFSKIIEVVSKGIVYGQSKYYTCAATSLRMVLESKGLKYSEEYLATALGTTQEGARILDIPNALYAIRQETNVVTKAYKKIKLEKLVELLKNGDTAIVSVFEKGKGSHAIIIDVIENGRVIIRDPLPINSGSSYSISIEEFELFFKKKAIIIKK